MSLDEGLETRLVNRHLAPIQPLVPGGVHVHAHHVVARIGETGAGDETHVAGAEDGDAHELSSRGVRQKGFGSLKEGRTRLKRGGRRRSAWAQLSGFWPCVGLAASARRRLAAKSATFVAGACGDTALRVHT